MLTAFRNTWSPDILEKILERFHGTKPSRVFGVDYLRIPLQNQETSPCDELLVTRFGVNYLQHILPNAWYSDKYYAISGTKLPNATSQAYRVPSKTDHGESVDLVVKFCRFATPVFLDLSNAPPRDINPEETAYVSYNGPFTEFGFVMQLREGAYGPSELHIETQLPLAIYIPSATVRHERCLDRSPSAFKTYELKLHRDQIGVQDSLELDIRKLYVMIYLFKHGPTIPEALELGWIGDREIPELTLRVEHELAEKGFIVWDNKPHHFIVEKVLKNGKPTLNRKDGEIIYSLCDFELLEPLKAWKLWHENKSRRIYLKKHAREKIEIPPRMPPNAQLVSYHGVDYVWTRLPNDENLWVVGHDPDYLSYFFSEHLQLDQGRQLNREPIEFRTVAVTTYQDIHIVVKESPVGWIPREDPFYEDGRRRLNYGFNTAFEEFAIAEWLRRLGIPTAYPRAILSAPRITPIPPFELDSRRFSKYGGMTTPDGEPCVNMQKEYLVVWGRWRRDPMEGYKEEGRWGLIDLVRAYAYKDITKKDYERLSDKCQRQLARLGLGKYVEDPTEIVLLFDDNGQLVRSPDGEFYLTVSIDALHAINRELMNEDEYVQLVEDFDNRLKAHNFEHLDLSGKYIRVLLRPLATDPEGLFERNERGLIKGTLVNFTFVKPPDEFYKR